MFSSALAAPHRCGERHHMDAIACRMLSSDSSGRAVLTGLKPSSVARLLGACADQGYRHPALLDAIEEHIISTGLDHYDGPHWGILDLRILAKLAGGVVGGEGGGVKCVSSAPPVSLCFLCAACCRQKAPQMGRKTWEVKEGAGALKAGYRGERATECLTSLATSKQLE